MPGQKSALDLVTEAYNAVWTDEERARQQEQQDGRTAFLANRAGAYVANTVVSVKTHAPTSPTRSRPNTREAAKAVSGAVTGPGRNARKDVYAQFGARARALLGLEESDGNDEVVDDDAPWNAAEHDLQSDNSDRDQAEFEEHRDKPADFESSSNDAESSPTAVETDTGVAVDAETPDEQAENDARDSVPESGSRCSTASAGSRDGSPSTARVFGGAEQTDSEKLQQLNEKAEEIDRISRMIADKIQTKLSGPSSNARGKQRESHIGPRARDLLQRTSPRRKNAKKTKARGKHGQIDRRFKGNPLARKQSASKSKTKLRPLRTRAKRPKSKLWEPKQGHHARSNSEDGAGAFARTSEAAPLPFPTSTSVIARGPSRKSRREVIDSVRDGKRRLKQKQQARKPWNRMEADALALIEQKKLEAQQKKQAKRRAAEIAQERLKTISVGQWLQVGARIHCCAKHLISSY